MQLPSVEVSLNGVKRKALVDSGCSQCICEVSCCSQWQRRNVDLRTIDGQIMRCMGTGKVQLRVNRTSEVSIDVIVVDRNPLGYKFILGMNGLEALGGVSIQSAKRVRFGVVQKSVCGVAELEAAERSSATANAPTAAAPPAQAGPEAKTGRVEQLRVDGEDFEAVYDPQQNVWLVEWKWSVEGPSKMRNRVGSYSVPAEHRDRYEAELRRWVDECWLIPYDASEFGEPKGLIPLMAVIQDKKQKVRPVMDYRELNEHIDAYTAEADVCVDKLRTWRKMGVEVTALDLKSAYLQIHVKKSLWCYQTVIFEGKRWALTRLGFGINVAPFVMKAVVNRVLSLDATVHEGTSSYVDDILVREDVVSAQRVRQHLATYGLLTKEPERVGDGTRLLGLTVWKERGNSCGGGGQSWTRYPPS